MYIYIYIYIYKYSCTALSGTPAEFEHNFMGQAAKYFNNLLKFFKEAAKGLSGPERGRKRGPSPWGAHMRPRSPPAGCSRAPAGRVVRWVSGVGFRVPGFGFRVPGFGCRGMNVGFRVSDFGFRVESFGFWVLGFGI